MLLEQIERVDTKIRTVLVLALFLIIPATANGARAITGYPRIIDGDSLTFGKERVRMERIDAPETRQSCGRKDGSDYPCGKLTTARYAHLARDSAQEAAGRIAESIVEDML